MTETSPLLALVDATADVNHPEFQGAHLQTIGGFPLSNAHGTETAAVAGAPKNNRGILGVWPGMREVNVSLPNQIACANSVAGIARAIQQGAAVINMSYGATIAVLRRVRRSCRSPPPRGSRSSPPPATSWPRATRCSSPPPSPT